MTQTADDFEIGDPVTVLGIGERNRPLPIGTITAVHKDRVSVSWPDGRSAIPTLDRVFRAGPRLSVAPDPVPVTEPVRVTPGLDMPGALTVQVPPEEFDAALVAQSVQAHLAEAADIAGTDPTPPAAEPPSLEFLRRGTPGVGEVRPPEWDPAYQAPQPEYFTEADPVDHPAHYTSDPSGVECIEITRHRSFNVGNAIKYLWRAGLKAPAYVTSPTAATITDLKKAAWYIQDEIARLESEVSNG